MKLSVKNLIIYSIISIGVFSVSTLSATEIPQNIQFKENTLVLNGQGTRIIFFMRVYEGSLYLKSESSDANAIINNDSPMAIRIDVKSEMVTAEAMKKALSEGLKKSTNNKTANISNEIEQLSSSFNSAVESRDYFEFVYIPEIGTHVLKNNELVELIPGLDFKKAFFGIFLSNNPIQKNLKKAMLGG